MHLKRHSERQRLTIPRALSTDHKPQEDDGYMMCVSGENAFYLINCWSSVVASVVLPQL